MELTPPERALAERIAGGDDVTGPELTDRAVSAVGFVVARRTEPTLPLSVWEARGHDADELREQLTEAEPLRGKALDEALRDAGLSTRGTADEKRARLEAGADGQDDA